MNLFYTLMPLLSGIFWGTSGTFVRTMADEHWDNMTILYGRMLTAVIMLLILILIVDRKLLRFRLKDLWIFLLGGAVFTLGLNAFYQETILRLTLSLAAVLLGMSPVFVLFAARIFFHEPITKAKVGSMFLAIFGCVLVSGVLENGSAGNVTPLNILIGIASAFCYGMQVISMRIASNRGYHPLTTTFYSLLSVAIVTFPLANHRAILTYTAAAPVPHWAFLFLQALCVSVLPFLLYNIALSRVESGKASILASAGEPSAATVFGMLIYHEIPSILSLLGLAVVIIALALLCRPERKAGAAD
ncbi:DMT family transporter [uncultured Eubacterium sp.]|uniref:DMT family transporter n=1 Tax=uncultured Eubacterium sp. TaxID=165185 RepID=UPI002598A52E|nr:DMT family transporter [uncultured Eubacterium sp.]